MVYGPGYVDYLLNGITYYAADDGELKSRGAGYYGNKLGYPYWSGTGPGQTGGGVGPYVLLSSYSTLATTAFGATSSVWNIDANATYSAVTAHTVGGNATTAFSFTGGELITIGRNFYNFGASMTGSAWALTLPAKYGIVSLNVAKSTDWFGVPFAVAISTVSGVMSVTNSTANHPVAAAQTSVGGIYTAGNSGTSPAWLSAITLDATSKANGWDNTQADIDTVTGNLTMTRFDNLVEMGFSKALRNAGGEVAASVAAQSATAADNLRLNNGSVNSSAVFSFPDAITAGNAGEYSPAPISSSLNDSTQRFSFQTAGSVSWNTDATGTFAGLGSVTAGRSTDRSGISQATVPNITLEKGRLYDLSGNPVVNRDGLNYNGATGAGLSAIYTGTLDAARPVLVSITLGQAAKNFPPTTYEDGHNYWHLVWSEPVRLDVTNTLGTGYPIINPVSGAQEGSVPSAVSTSIVNPKASSAFGDSYGTGTIQLTGLAQYPGNLYRGSRSDYPTIASIGNQGTLTPTNSLARSAAGNDLYIYLTGYTARRPRKYDPLEWVLVG